MDYKILLMLENIQEVLDNLKMREGDKDPIDPTEARGIPPQPRGVIQIMEGQGDRP